MWEKGDDKVDNGFYCFYNSGDDSGVGDKKEEDVKFVLGLGFGRWGFG